MRNVFGDVGENGWFQGELTDGTRGLVPSNLVAELSDDELDTPGDPVRIPALLHLQDYHCSTQWNNSMLSRMWLSSFGNSLRRLTAELHSFIVYEKQPNNCPLPLPSPRTPLPSPPKKDKKTPKKP